MSDKHGPGGTYFSLFNIGRATRLESTTASADFWGAVLVLGLGGVYLLIVGAFFLIKTFWVPLLLAYIASVLGFALYYGQKVVPKVQLTADTDVCQLPVLDNHYAVVLGVRDHLNEEGHPRSTYFSIKTEGSYLVDVVIPDLDRYGKVVLNHSTYMLKEVTVEWDSRPTRSVEYNMLQQLAPVLQDYHQLEAEIMALQAQRAEIERLVALLSTSELYQDEVETYRRASAGLDTLLLRSEDLKSLYLSLVREGLIAQKVQGYSPEKLPLDAPVLLYSRYEAAREELQSMKETARAYSQLLKEQRA
ncbi:MAG: hypothetical protein H7Y22_17275 [Gemmatimonadaceae bacterium]|nr:hypothetical protein [Gloeobacterales cyanobacterium ES-bin-141]